MRAEQSEQRASEPVLGPDFELTSPTSPPLVPWAKSTWRTALSSFSTPLHSPSVSTRVGAPVLGFDTKHQPSCEFKAMAPESKPALEL